MEKCSKCGMRFPSKTEESAFQKTRAANPEEWEKLRKKIKKVCTCPEGTSNAFTSSVQPPDLQWHDKFDP